MKGVNYRRDCNKLFLLLIFGFITHSFCDNLSSSTNAGVKSPAVSKQKLNATNLNNNHDNINYVNNKANATKNNQKPSVNFSESQKSVGDKNGNSTSVVNKQSDHINNQTASDGSESLKGHMLSLNSGAIKRAFYVFVGLSVLSVAYLLFRSTRLRQSPAQMVRKYGVLAHKQDIEMRPLPLDEDDEDDTVVFDASGFTKNLQTSSKNF
ncbi:uncharacterized protein [Chelonus insularis]|uniref:uncharacterized protein n=1 Tax=Chelonus insularis TaxID=460826 RepID=UPI00158D289D|nr:uncharacterized protein LOC118067625 [Chelonus insularis]